MTKFGRYLYLFAALTSSFARAAEFSCENSVGVPAIPSDPRIDDPLLSSSFKYQRELPEAFDRQKTINLSNSPLWNPVLKKLDSANQSGALNFSGSLPPGLNREVLGEVLELSKDEIRAPEDVFKSAVQHKWSQGWENYLSTGVGKSVFEELKDKQYTEWKLAKANGENVEDSPPALSQEEWSQILGRELESRYNKKINEKSFEIAQRKIKQYSAYSGKNWDSWVQEAQKMGVPSNTRVEDLENLNQNSQNKLPLSNELVDIWSQSIGLVENERLISEKNGLRVSASKNTHGESNSISPIRHDSQIAKRDFNFDTSANLSNDLMIQALNSFLNPKIPPQEASLEHLKEVWQKSLDDLMKGKGIALYSISGGILPNDITGEKFRNKFQTQLTLAETYQKKLAAGVSGPEKPRLESLLSDLNIELEKTRSILKKQVRITLSKFLIDQLSVGKHPTKGMSTKEFDKVAETHAEKVVREKFGMKPNDHVPPEYKKQFNDEINYQKILYQREHMDPTNPLWSTDIDGDGKEDIQGMDQDEFTNHGPAYKKYEAYSEITGKQKDYMTACLDENLKEALSHPPENNDENSYQAFTKNLTQKIELCSNTMIGKDLARLKNSANEFGKKYYTQFMASKTMAHQRALAFGATGYHFERGLEYLIKHSEANQGSKDHLAENRQFQRQEANYIQQTYKIGLSNDQDRQLDLTKLDISSSEKLVDDPRARNFLMQNLGSNAVASMELLLKLGDYDKSKGTTSSKELGPQVIGDTVFWVGSNFNNVKNRSGNMTSTQSNHVMQMPIEEYRKMACKEGKEKAQRLTDSLNKYHEALQKVQSSPYKNFFATGYRGLEDNPLRNPLVLSSPTLLIRELMNRTPGNNREAPTKELRELDQAQKQVLDNAKEMNHFKLHYGLSHETALSTSMRQALINETHIDPNSISGQSIDSVIEGIKSNAEYLKSNSLKTGGKLAVGVASFYVAAGAGAVTSLGVRASAMSLNTVKGANFASKALRAMTTRASIQAEQTFGKVILDAGIRTEAFHAGAVGGRVAWLFGNSLNPINATFAARSRHKYTLSQGEESNYWDLWQEEFSSGFEGATSIQGAIQAGVMLPAMASLGHFYKLGKGTPWRLFNRWTGKQTFAQLLKTNPARANFIANLQANVVATAAMKPLEVGMIYNAVSQMNPEISKLETQYSEAKNEADKKAIHQQLTSIKAQKVNQISSMSRDFLLYDIGLGALFLRMPAEFFSEIRLNKSQFNKGIEASFARHANEISFWSKNTNKVTMKPEAYQQYMREVSKIKTLRDPSAKISDYSPAKFLGKDAEGNYTFEFDKSVDWNSFGLRNKVLGRTLFPPSLGPDYYRVGTYD